MHFNYRTWSAFFAPEPSISCQTIRCRWNDFYDFTTRICSLPTFDRRREKLPEFHLALSGAHPTPPRKMGIKYKKSSSTRSSFWCLSVEAGWGGVIYVLFHVSVCSARGLEAGKRERERERALECFRNVSVMFHIRSGGISFAPGSCFLGGSRFIWGKDCRGARFSGT